MPSPIAAAVAEDASETEIVAFCHFLEQHYGSILRAWRYVLDPNGDGELLYPEFMGVVAAMPTWQGDVTALWAALVRRARSHTEDTVLRLRELSLVDYQCLEDFRKWADVAFGGVLEVFKAATDERPNAMMTFFEFEEVCRSNGFNGDCHKIFYGCLSPDGSEKGVSIRDMAYLETRAIKRREAMDPGFVLQQQSAKAAAKRLRHRKQRLKRGQAEALEEFVRKVRKANGGSFIRGWRRVLDTNGNLSISKTELLKGCQKIAYSGDVVALWKAMDVDDDGIVQLEEVDVQLALVLASFKKWASLDESGSCVAKLVQLGSLTKRQSSKWDQEGFTTALRLANFPGCPGSGATDKQTAAMLYEAFDVGNIGSFTVQDIAFLDRWGPTSWLSADPSVEGKERFMKALKSRYPNLIVAWRKLLDRDNSNKVSYKEFLEACRVLKMDNPASIWRVLDDDSSGFISLNEIDQEAADTLLNFKQWAEGTFGTITHMFHVFDKPKVGKVGFPVFRRALRNFGYKGDACVLFQSLKPNSSGKSSKKGVSRHELTLQDLLYLSTWECGDMVKDYADLEEEGGSKKKPDAVAATSSLCSPAPLAAPTETVPRRGVQTQGQNQQTAASADGPGVPLPRVKASSESMVHCRSIDEYRAFIQAGQRQKLLDAYGRNHNEKLLDSIDQGSAQQKLPHLFPSRGALAGPFLAPAVADIGGLGRKMHRGRTGSKSASPMHQLPRVSPNGGRCNDSPTALRHMPFAEGDIADRIMAKKAQRLQQVVSLPSL